VTKSHPQQWAIVTEDDRPDAAAVAALAAFPTTQLADCGGPVAIVGSAGSSCAPVTWCAATPAASSSSRASTWTRS
jgi:hypothetical protein